MSVALSERLRAQLDKPLTERNFLFVFFSLLVGLPLSLLWACVASLRGRHRFRLQNRPARNEPWIISIGNVAVGGTGKSPIVRAFARAALNAEYDVAILARGFGKEAAGGLVFELQSIKKSVSSELWSGKWADECLEHALVLSEDLREGETLWIGQGVDRAQLLKQLLQLRGPAVRAENQRPLLVLLDDGLSQTKLPVHHDVVVWDPFAVIKAPRACLPLGPYRMGWPGRFWASSIPRADVTVWSRSVRRERVTEFLQAVGVARQVVRSSKLAGVDVCGDGTAEQAVNVGQELFACENSRLVRVSAHLSGIGFALQALAQNEWPARCAVMTGLARPQRFIRTLHGMAGDASPIVVTEVLHLEDHGSFNDIARRFVDRSEPLMTSLKDLCRWWSEPVLRETINCNHLFVLCLEVDLLDLHGQQKVNFERLFYSAAERGELNVSG